ncbi:MAG: SLC13 family permease [Sphaerochaetaceae bacterium]
MQTMQWIVLLVTIAMYAVVIARPQYKAHATCIAAVILLLLRVVTLRLAFTSLINWNVLLIYAGSLAIAELFIYSRAPACIADRIIDHSPNVGLAIVSILMMTGIISAFVENVATVLVMAPICLALSKKLKMDPTYFMVGLAVMANLQGTATLVGDPPSMIFATYANYGFNDFFFYQGKFSIFWIVQIGMLAGSLFFYLYFRKNTTKKVVIDKQKMISIVPSFLLIAMIVGLAVCSFFANGVSFASGLLVFLLGILGLVWYHFSQKYSWKDVGKLVRSLDWETIIFLIGIFVVIGAISEVGLLQLLSDWLGRLVGGNVLLGYVAILLVSVLISGFVDNVPYIIVMLPVAATLGENLGLQPELYMFALLIGSCLGGNLTPFGASANVVAVGILKKQGVKMGFRDWLKIGIPFTLITTIAASLALWSIWR